MKKQLLCLLLSAMATTAPARDIVLANATLTERSGDTMQFRSQAIGDRIALVGFTWGGCTTVCPITDRIMAETHEKMGARLGEVRLVTLTLDPLGDPPKSLARRATELGAGTHWLWLGGDFRRVEQVLAGLDANAPILDEHPPFFLIIDGQSGQVIRKQGLPSSDELIAAVDALLDARVAR